MEYKKDAVKKWSSTLHNNLSFKTKGGQVANLRNKADAKYNTGNNSQNKCLNKKYHKANYLTHKA